MVPTIYSSRFQDKNNEWAKNSTKMAKTSISWKFVWKYLKIQIKFWKFNLIISLFHVWDFFQTWTLRSVARWVYLTLSYNKIEYRQMAPLHRVRVWNKFWDRIKLSKIQINIGLRFEINSNGFSRDRSFGHDSQFASFLANKKT